MVITLVVQLVVTNIFDMYRLADSITFTDYDSFVAFMEQPVEWDGSYHSESVAAPAPDSAITYYDQYGNEISEEEALTEQLVLADGTVVCEYLRRNGSLSHISYGKDSDGLLPITVITHDALRTGFARVNLIHGACGVLYCMEFVAAVVLYRKKR